jgi:hypothetical protein
LIGLIVALATGCLSIKNESRNADAQQQVDAGKILSHHTPTSLWGVTAKAK